MKAYLEVIAGVLRAGPDCEGWLDPFDYAAAIAGDGPNCTIKALVAGKEQTMIPYLRAAFPSLRAVGFKHVRFDHRGHLVEMDL